MLMYEHSSEKCCMEERDLKTLSSKYRRKDNKKLRSRSSE
jgi:hypothetical protein